MKPQRRDFKKGKHLTHPVLNPTAPINPAKLWKARQRNLFILTPEGKIYKGLDLNRFDPDPGKNSALGNHYQYLKGFILDAGKPVGK